VPRAPWARWPTEKLLDVRFRDLDLRLEGTWVEQCVDQLYAEFEARGIRLRPHVWISEEWFSPDGVPGIAIPFYLVHPRLIRLERTMMLEAEGATRETCMKLLRHEAGHAVQHAYEVHRRKRWREHFGSSAQPYPDFYWPRPGSKKFVQHLDAWYAQSHPAEDFAETFAVWLPSRSRWRRRYAGWPALRKLEYVDELMRDLAGIRPRVKRRERPYTLRRLSKTLRQHYGEKRERYKGTLSEAYDDSLAKLFPTTDRRRARETAASFLRRHRRVIRDTVCDWTGEYRFTVDQVLKEMILRCQEKKLRASGDPAELQRDVTVFLVVQTMHYLYRGGGWHAV